MGSTTLIDLCDFDSFRRDPRVRSLVQNKYKHDYVLAKRAARQVTKDLQLLNDEYFEKNGRSAFTTVEGRPKPLDSLLRKLFRMCREKARTCRITSKLLVELYGEIHDLCGARFSCPYLDEVETFVFKLIRPKLARKGYETDLQKEPSLRDKNYLDQGDEVGYRSYHFFIRVPTPVDIWGNKQPCLCTTIIQNLRRLRRFLLADSRNPF
ncbi:hypothetical protein FJY63_13820 [Candidatus Sumerlaeota bacterium]|nr:hypothetical protein [Candidatus Sumerlaeota bacterium]